MEASVKRTFVVKHPFQGTRVENKDHTRTFEPGETLQCEVNQMSDSVIFEVDLVQFKVGLAELAKSVKTPDPRRRP
jgi:hypothetical protein